MGAETGNGRQGEQMTFTADYKRVMSGAVSRAMSRADTPLDGGWGYDSGMTELERYKARKLQEIFGDQEVPESWAVIWGAHVPYAGEEPEPSFTRPGYRGMVVYEQDDSRPPGERMVPSVRWQKVKDGRPDFPS